MKHLISKILICMLQGFCETWVKVGFNCDKNVKKMPLSLQYYTMKKIVNIRE